MKRLIYILLPLVLMACKGNNVYTGSQRVDDEGWRMDSIYSFQFEIKDTTKAYTVEFLVRNTSQYKYQNLWLFVKKVEPDFTSKGDTVQLFLADDFGNWLGSGIGSYYSAEYIYKDSVHFSQPGTYQYLIRHGMRTDSLEGIHDIGLSVYVKKQD